MARGRDYTDVTPLKGVYHGGSSHGLAVNVELTGWRDDHPGVASAVTTNAAAASRN